MPDTEKQLTLDYKMLFETDRGQRVFNDMKRRARFDVSYVPKDSLGRYDPFEMARQEGRRSFIIHIQTQLSKDINKEKQEFAKGANDDSETASS